MRLEGEALRNLAEVGRAEGSLVEACALAERSLAVQRTIGAADGIALGGLTLGRSLIQWGLPDAAREPLEEGSAVSSRLSLPDPGPLPAAYLALTGERDRTQVEVPGSVPVAIGAEAHFVLPVAGVQGSRLVRALALLEKLSVHLQGAAGERVWTNNPVARRVVEFL